MRTSYTGQCEQKKSPAGGRRGPVSDIMDVTEVNDPLCPVHTLVAASGEIKDVIK